MHERHSWVTDKMFDEKLREIVESPEEDVLAIPGVHEILSEFYNNEVLSALTEDRGEVKRIAIVPDADYETRGSYAYDTEEQTRAAEDAELAGLASGELAAYGVVVYAPCGDEDHGWDCPHATTDESVWGTVADAGHDGTYDSPGDIRDPYLRETAQTLWDE